MHEYLDKCSTSLSNNDGGLDGHLCTARVNHEVNLARAGLDDAELLLHRGSIATRVVHLAFALQRLGRQPGVRRRVRLSKLEPGGDDVDGDDPGRTKRLGDRHAKQAYRAASKDNDGLGGPEIADVRDGVDGYAERLDLRFIYHYNECGRANGWYVPWHHPRGSYCHQGDRQCRQAGGSISRGCRHKAVSQRRPFFDRANQRLFKH